MGFRVEKGTFPGTSSPGKEDAKAGKTLGGAQRGAERREWMAERGGRDYRAKPQTNGERFNLIRELLSLLYYADYKSFKSKANQNRDLFRALRVATSSPCPSPTLPSGSGGRAASRGEGQGPGMQPPRRKQGESQGKAGQERLGGIEPGKRDTGISGMQRMGR